MSEQAVKVPLHDLVTHFEKIRSEQGEEAYLKARSNFARVMILKPRGDEFLKSAFPDLDLEAVRAEVAKQVPAAPSVVPNPQEAMLQAIRAQIPNLKTQAQFNLFMKTFDALRLTLNAAFGLDESAFNEGKKALDLALNSALAISKVVDQLQEMPEAATSLAAEEFKQPPREFQEYDVHKSLVTELGMISNSAELHRWYDKNRSRIDQVVSQSLRDDLFDKIRSIKKTLGETN